MLHMLEGCRIGGEFFNTMLAAEVIIAPGMRQVVCRGAAYLHAADGIVRAVIAHVVFRQLTEFFQTMCAAEVVIHAPEGAFVFTIFSDVHSTYRVYTHGKSPLSGLVLPAFTDSKEARKVIDK